MIDKNNAILNAQRYAVKGQIEKAIEEWQKVLNENPNEGNIYNTIGDLYLKNNSTLQAIEAYLKAADIFNKAGFTLKSIAVYKKVLKIDPERYDLCIRLGDLNAERGLISNAIQDYLSVAKIYAKQGLIKDCIDVYMKIADLDPANTSIRLKIAELCIKEKLYNEAIEEYVKVADEYLKNKEMKEAEDIYNQILSYDHGNRHAILKLKEINNIVELSNAGKMMAEAENFLQKSDYESAENIIARLMEIDPTEVKYREKYCYVLLMKQDMQAALYEFMTLANEFINNGFPERAERLMKDYIDIDAKRIEAHEIMIKIYEKMGEREKIISQYCQLINIYIENGTITEGEVIYKKLLEIYPYSKEAESYKDIFGEKIIASSNQNEELLNIEEIKSDSDEIYEDFTISEEELSGELSIDNAKDNANSLAEISDDSILGDQNDEDKIISSLITPSLTTDEKTENSEDDLILKIDLKDEEIGGEDFDEIIYGNQLNAIDVGSKEDEKDISELIPEMIEEADFYLQQGLKEEAEKIYKKILEIDPENKDAKSVLENIGRKDLIIDEETLGIEEISFSDESDESIEEVPNDNILIKDKSEKEVPDGEKEEYYDLSDFLTEEVEEEPVVLDNTNQEIIDESIEEIFKEFQKGVQEQFGNEDYETHYDLGIAYKEMGLVNEAINEFLLSLKGKNRFVDSSSLLAKCYEEKGQLNQAIERLENVIENSETEEIKNILYIKYDVGSLYEKVNQYDMALMRYSEIYDVDKTLMDVANKLEELEKRLNKSYRKGINKQIVPDKEPGKAESTGSVPKKKSRILYV